MPFYIDVLTWTLIISLSMRNSWQAVRRYCPQFRTVQFPEFMASMLVVPMLAEMAWCNIALAMACLTLNFSALGWLAVGYLLHEYRLPKRIALGWSKWQVALNDFALHNENLSIHEARHDMTRAEQRIARAKERQRQFETRRQYWLARRAELTEHHVTPTDAVGTGSALQPADPAP